MDYLSKDVLAKICPLLEKKDVLILRTMSKRFNRLISIYIDRHYYFNLVSIIPPLIDFMVGFFLTPNQNQNQNQDQNQNRDQNLSETQSETMISKIKKMNKLSINIDITKISNHNLYLLFENVRSIRFFKCCLTEYHFLSLFKSLKKIVFDGSYNIISDVYRKFPPLDNVNTFVIEALDSPSPFFKFLNCVSIYLILKTFPNIHKLVCIFLKIDLSIIPKIKYLQINDFIEYNFFNITYEKSLNRDIIFDHLEKLVIDDIFVFRNIPQNTMIHMLNLRYMCIKSNNSMQRRFYNKKKYGGKMPSINREYISIIEKIIIDPVKLEYLKFGCACVMNSFFHVYPKDTFTSLKQVILF